MYNNIQTSERSEQVNDDAIDNQQLPVQRTRPAMVEQHHERLKRRSPALIQVGNPLWVSTLRRLLPESRKVLATSTCEHVLILYH